ncbi:hypothetical protein MKX01_024560 [Papaver californicum]|nr:hypothetical protein MKX01_024560 [Papaver californicum]
MEKYAVAAALAAGLPPTNFYYTPAVGEALPAYDASMDAVIGTLVLCSVKDVKTTLKEVKRVLKPGTCGCRRWHGSQICTECSGSFAAATC